MCTRSHFYVCVYMNLRKLCGGGIMQKQQINTHRAKESRKTASVSIVNFDFVSSIKLKVCVYCYTFIYTHTHPNTYKYTLNRMPFLSLSHQFHFFPQLPFFCDLIVFVYVIPLIFSRFGCCCWFFVCFSNRIGTCGIFSSYSLSPL